ncbi:hypothetical protein [Ktedonobacter racemifer]|uniref:Exonuclease n=1 Tax=Ktedonobacter racemifer DSM 44963 TaxID=485913 RepID=D6TGR6_KTERA|nr:hypothetical protein [Ktedonobacter racemifer]EFH88845.1 Exonuclease [Ktedonobacter racemifer DSM 44963]
MTHIINPFPFDYQQAIEQARALLEEEQQASLLPAGNSRAVRAQRREHLEQLLMQIQVRMQQDIGHLRYALHTLPPLPPLQEIRWAQEILARPDLAIFHLTTAGLSHDAEIIAVTLVDRAGLPIKQLVVRPMNPISFARGETYGLSAAQLASAPSLPEVWDHLAQSCQGRFLLSFQCDYDLARLAEAAAQLHLPPLCVQMEDLRAHTRAYFGELGLRLSDLCQRCGITLPPTPNPLQCAQAFHAVLCAMAHAGGED